MTGRAIEFPDTPTVPSFMPEASIRRMFEEARIAEEIEAIERAQRRGAVHVVARGVLAMLAAIW